MTKKQTSKNGRHPSAGKLAKFTDVPNAPVPLNDTEYSRLEVLIAQSADSNIDLFNAAKDVGRLRMHLDSAEDELKRAKAQNIKIHAEMAPLLHRLPTV